MPMDSRVPFDNDDDDDDDDEDENDYSIFDQESSGRMMRMRMSMRTTVVFSTRIPLKIRDARSDKKKKRLTTMLPVIRPSDIVRCHWSIFPAWSLVLVTRS